MPMRSRLHVALQLTDRTVLTACIIAAFAAIAFYLYLLIPVINLPADLLIWAETDFVANIIKLQTGAPIYTPPEDSNSNVYTPGASVLTYVVLKLVRAPVTVRSMRYVQMAFVVLAALLATWNWHLLRRLALPGVRRSLPVLWTLLVFPCLFLAATAPGVNQHVHTLHTSALDLLISMAAWWAALRYTLSPGRLRLLTMAIVPALGFAVKQSIAGWAALFFVVVLLDSQAPVAKRIRNVLLLACLSVAGVAIVVALFYSLWGRNFEFWAFGIMGGPRLQVSLNGVDSISLMRCIDHLLRAWLPIAAGFFGGWVLMRGKNLARLGPLFLGWLVMLAQQAFLSGSNWGVLYYFGPSVVIGASWFLVAVSTLWRPGEHSRPNDESTLWSQLVRPALGAASVLTLMAALKVLPSGDPAADRYIHARLPVEEMYEYIHRIEAEFEGLEPNRVLLGVGNWVYLRHGTLAKDRAVSLADQPVVGIYENFQGFLGRIRRQEYDKILVHDYHTPVFLYDWFTWRRSSGVRSALSQYYEEARVIPSVKGGSIQNKVFFSTDVSVLVPKRNFDLSPPAG